MRIGFGAIPDGPIESVVELVGLAETLGYDSAWIPDQTFHRDPFVLLTRCALSTARIRLILGITSPLTRHPVQVARAIATVAELAPGRIVLGYGVGNVRQLVSRLGFSSRGAPSRVHEAVVLTRHLLAGQRVTFSSEHFTLEDVALELADPVAVPIHVAGRGPKMLEVAGTVADGVIIGSLVSQAAIDWALGHVARGVSTRPPDLDAPERVTWASSFIRDGADDASVALHPMVAHVAAGAPQSVLGALGIADEEVARLRTALADGDELAAAAAVTPAMVETFALAGTPEGLRHTIERLRDQGFAELGVLLQQPTFPERAAFLTRFAEVAQLV